MTDAVAVHHPAEAGDADELVVLPIESDVSGATAKRKLQVAEWIAAFRTGEVAPSRLTVHLRMTQDIVDSLAGQTGLAWLRLGYFGTFTDVEAIGRLTGLRELKLDNAAKLLSVEPIGRLTHLTRLSIDNAFSVADPSPLGRLTQLEELHYGNHHLGIDKLVPVPDLEWVRPLIRLRSLSLGGIRLLGSDLSPLAALPELREIGLPLRRDYRAQVEALAADSPAFAKLAESYLYLDELRRQAKQNRSA